MDSQKRAFLIVQQIQVWLFFIFIFIKVLKAHHLT